jgi:hypothetical protein
MEIEVKFNEIKSLDDLKENLSGNLMLKIFDMKWVDIKGNKLNEDEYKYYDVQSNLEFDLDYLIDNCDYNNFRRIDLMVEQLEENGFDLFETLDEMINDYFLFTSVNPNVYLKCYDFKLFSYTFN